MKEREMIWEIVRTVSDGVVVVGRDGQAVTVREIVNGDAAYLLYGRAMAEKGVALIEGRPGRPRPALAAKDFIFIDLVKLKKGMLKGTEVAGWPNLKAMLDLIQDADVSAQRTMPDGRVSGVQIPLDNWRALVARADAVAAELHEDIMPTAA